MIDFHCHISTHGSHMPESDGRYYNTLKPLVESGEWAGIIWQETIETLSETFRSEAALKQYEQMSPLIYTEMARRLLNTEADRLTMEMAHHLVAQAVVVAVDPYIPTIDVVNACSKTKGILIAFGSVDPWDENWENNLRQTLTLPISGFKFHDQLQQLPYSNPRMSEIMRVIAAERPGFPVYLHTGNFPIYKPIEDDWVHGLRILLDNFPSLNFVCGHCGWNRPSEALRAARRYSNLWLETSWQPPAVLRRLCDLLGPTRLVYGSDYPLFSMRRSIRNCKAALTPQEQRLVMEENAHNLMENANAG